MRTVGPAGGRAVDGRERGRGAGWEGADAEAEGIEGVEAGTFAHSTRSGQLSERASEHESCDKGGSRPWLGSSRRRRIAAPLASLRNGGLP
eukprot:3338769-Rhodomonas_salina.1